MKKTGIILLLLLNCFYSYSQRKADREITLENKVKDLIIVPFNGIVAVSDGNNIQGYSPNEEKIIWETSIPKKNIESIASQLRGGITPENILSLNTRGGDFDVIPDTPFLQKFFDNRLYIINSFTGEFIFESNSRSIFYFQSEYLFDEDALILRGIEDNKLIVAKYDLKNKDFKWKTVISENFGSVLAKLTNLLKNDGGVNAKDKLEVVDDKIFLLAKSKFYCLKNKSGELLWKNEEVDVDNFFYNQGATNVLLSEVSGVFGTRTLLSLLKAENGTPVWKSPLKTKRLILFEDWQDKMLLGHYYGFNFFDYTTGKKVWKKDPKGKNIKSVIPVGNDFLYVYDDEMMLLDKNGAKKWKKDVKICDDETDPIYFLEKTKNGKILYVTGTYANLVDYSTGKKYWKGNLKLNEKRPTVAKYDENSKNFVIYNDEKLYKFNENTQEKPKPYAKLKLKSEKTISNMELFDDFVSITGQSDVMGVDSSGAVKFHNKYSQPGELGRKFLKSALAVGNTVALATQIKVEVHQVTRDSQGNEVHTKVGEISFDKKTQQIGAAGYFAGSAAKKLVKDRFNALQQTDKYSILFAKGEEAQKLLIRVDKETGEELDKIIVENNKPIYDYDPVTKDLYYSIKNKVQIFKGN